MGQMVKRIGNRPIILSVQSDSKNREAMEQIKKSLDSNTNGAILYDDFLEAPGFSEMDTAAHFTRQSNADIIIAVGSRDTFHAARALSLLAVNEIFTADLVDYSGELKHTPLPVVTVPVEPSMGEECSSGFFLYDSEQDRHIQRFDERIFPSLVFIDPGHLGHLSDQDFLRNGLAIMAAAIETILSRAANEITNSIALRALELASRNMQHLIDEPHNLNTRTNISMAGLMSGMAHGGTAMGLCYSLAVSVSTLTDMNFFLAMAILLPHVMDFNLTISAARYIHIARALDEDIKEITVIEAAIKAVEGIRKLYTDANLPQRLSDFEIRKVDLPGISQMAASLPTIKNAMRDVDRSELETILISAY